MRKPGKLRVKHIWAQLTPPQHITVTAVKNILCDGREEEHDMREKERQLEKKREKEKKDVQGQILSICIQFSKRKTIYI